MEVIAGFGWGYCGVSIMAFTKEGVIAEWENEGGIWKYGGRPLANAETDWIEKNGWNILK